MPAAHRRAATYGQGWVAPLFGLSVLQEGAAAVQKAWAEAGRPGRPWIVTGRYFSLGDGADAVADEYIRHYYGDEFFAPARADTLTTTEQLHAELAGCKRPTTMWSSTRPQAGSKQVALLAEAVQETEFLPARNPATVSGETSDRKKGRST